MILNQRVALATSMVKDCSRRLCEIVEQEYPVGTVWLVETGGTTITAKVTGHHDCWWSDPDQIIGINIVTGKKRKWKPYEVIGQVLESKSKGVCGHLK